MPRLFWKQWELTEKVFHVPSADRGIVFEVTVDLAGSCPEWFKERALPVALGAVIEVVAPIAKRFDVLCADASEALANRACMTIRKPHRKLRVQSVALKFSAARPQIEAATHLAALQRTAAVAGREAVRDAARADALQQVVLGNHAAAVAHLLLTRPPEQWTTAATDAADLVRDIEDLRPGRPWIGVMQAIISLRDRHDPEHVRKMATDLAAWAETWDEPLAQTLQDAAAGENTEISPAAELDGQSQNSRSHIESG